MSRTTVKGVFPGKRVEDIEVLRNSHGSAPVIWNEMAKRYLGLKDFEYWTERDGLWVLNGLLALYERISMPRHHRIVLKMTYDNALVMRTNYKQAARDIRAFLTDFPVRKEYANHWPRIAEIFDSEPNYPAIGFHMTSVSEDPFQGPFNEETEEHDPPEWDLYWDVYAEAVNSIK